MTEAEVLKIIENVAKRLAYKYRFGYYDVDDIKQEARIEAWKCLDRYNGKHPLENFLFTHVKNRLFNLKRDKYSRLDKPCFKCPLNAYCKETDECKEYVDLMECKWYNGWIVRNSTKSGLMDTMEYNHIDDTSENTMKEPDGIDSIMNNELIELIDRELSVEFRHDWLRIREGVQIPRIKLNKLKQAIILLLEENNIDPQSWYFE